MRTSPVHEVCCATVVRAPGSELDLASAPALRALLQAGSTPGGTVVLDLQDVSFLDSSAVDVVVSADRQLRQHGGRLRLVHVRPNVQRVLRLCGLADRLAMPSPHWHWPTAAPRPEHVVGVPAPTVL